LSAVEPFRVIEPTGRARPLVITVPHSGTKIPADLAKHMASHLAANPPDTDWLVDELYGFAKDMGVTMIVAPLSRYVIDLNRDPSGMSLYADGRDETALVPMRTFGGEAIYPSAPPDKAQINDRLEKYFWPWYRCVTKALESLRAQFGHVLMFDAHSIARLVPSIRPGPFPDMILGSRDAKSAHPELITTALNELKSSGRWSIAHNDPFKGGYMTRSFGKPETGIHALQLEMSQDVYMRTVAGRPMLDDSKIVELREMLFRVIDRLALRVEAGL